CKKHPEPKMQFTDIGGVGGRFYSIFLANHCVCSREKAFSQFKINSEKSSSFSMATVSALIRTISCAVKEYEEESSLCFFACNHVKTDEAATAIASIGKSKFEN